VVLSSAQGTISCFILTDDGNEDGAFLVRESNTAVGDYVLSVLHEGEAVHYQIRRHGEDAFFSIGKYNFENIMWEDNIKMDLR
jgi:tyrosine-protein kinase